GGAGAGRARRTEKRIAGGRSAPARESYSARTPMRHRDEDSTPIEAALAALADGSLPPERRAQIETRVAGSPELAAELALQRSARTALRALEQLPAPASLHASIAAQLADASAARSGRRRRGSPPPAPAPPPGGAAPPG